MTNPFRYGGVVGEEAFCNRKQELADLQRAMENGERLFLYSERRLGKTSLVRLALSRLAQRKFIPVYIDLWPTDGAESFVAATAKAIAKRPAAFPDTIITSSAKSWGIPELRAEIAGMRD